MIYHVSGALGSGKSMYASHLISEWLTGFKTVFTNIPLVDGWDFILSKYQMMGVGSFLRYWRSDYVRSIDYQAHLASAYSKHYRFFSDIHEACETAIKEGPAVERSKLFIFDEAQLFINSRDWKERSKVILAFTTQSRKLGFEVYLISQEREAVDKQVRNLAEVHITLKNLGNVRPLGFKVFPNMGLLVKRHPSTSTLLGIERIKYAAWVGSLYRSSQLFSTKQDLPVSWSSRIKGEQWVSGCRARYERGCCDFKKIASNHHVQFVARNIEPFIDRPELVDLADEIAIGGNGRH